jgi:peptidoglycan/LPS O-acetylase OafA/YrhL
LKGGFVGVDIFFVISGYLVMGALIRDSLQKKKPSEIPYMDVSPEGNSETLVNLEDSSGSSSENSEVPQNPEVPENTENSSRDVSSESLVPLAEEPTPPSRASYLEYHSDLPGYFSEFLARRIKRLLFPSSMCLLLILLGASLLEPRDRWAGSFLDIAAAGAHGVNFWFYRGVSDYFSADTQNSLVLHFWSLSLEEQFYLFFPILYMGFTWMTKKVGKFGVTEIPVSVFLVVVILASMIPCFIIPRPGFFDVPPSPSLSTALLPPSSLPSFRHPSSSFNLRSCLLMNFKEKFFLTPFRFWEFLVGALVWMHEKKLPAEKIPFFVPLIISVGLVLAGVFVPEE